jgi:hypothetical protein
MILPNSERVRRITERLMENGNVVAARRRRRRRRRQRGPSQGI